MKNYKIKNIIISNKVTINNALKKIQENGSKILCCVNKNNELKGIINDGDIRRAIIKKISLNTQIKKILNKNPVTANYSSSIDEIKRIFLKNKIDVLPVIKNKQIINIISKDDIININNQTSIVIIAGGEGKRLYPHTKKKPKILVKINKRLTIGDTLINNFISQGFDHFIFLLHHKSKKIKSHFINRYKNTSIDFVTERIPLGTCGGLSLLKKENLSKNFILINCDIATGIDFGSLIYFHENQKADLTIVTYQKKIDLPYGNINFDNYNLTSVEEKPDITFTINTGIYVINKDLLDYLDKNKKIDFTDFIKTLRNKNKKIKIYPSLEYWYDIGTPKDLIDFKCFLKTKSNVRF